MLQGPLRSLQSCPNKDVKVQARLPIIEFSVLGGDTKSSSLWWTNSSVFGGDTKASVFGGEFFFNHTHSVIPAPVLFLRLQVHKKLTLTLEALSSSFMPHTMILLLGFFLRHQEVHKN